MGSAVRTQRNPPETRDGDNFSRVTGFCEPDGSEQWLKKAVAQFGLENTLRNSGRPRNGA